MMSKKHDVIHVKLIKQKSASRPRYLYLKYELACTSSLPFYLISEQLQKSELWIKHRRKKEKVTLKVCWINGFTFMLWWLMSRNKGGSNLTSNRPIKLTWYHQRLQRNKVLPYKIQSHSVLLGPKEWFCFLLNLTQIYHLFCEFYF